MVMVLMVVMRVMLVMMVMMMKKERDDEDGADEGLAQPQLGACGKQSSGQKTSFDLYLSLAHILTLSLPLKQL